MAPAQLIKNARVLSQERDGHWQRLSMNPEHWRMYQAEGKRRFIKRNLTLGAVLGCVIGALIWLNPVYHVHRASDLLFDVIVGMCVGCVFYPVGGLVHWWLLERKFGRN